MSGTSESGGRGPEAAGGGGSSGSEPEWRPSLYVVLVLGLFAAFLASVRSVLSPFVLFVVLIYAAWPLARVHPWSRLVWAAVAVGLLWILQTTGLLLLPFILALIFAYILDPLVDRLVRFSVPRTAAVALLALPLLGLAALVVFVLFPAVARQISQLVENVPGYVDAAEGWLVGVRAWIVGLNLPGISEETVPQLREFDAQRLGRWVQERRAALASSGWDALLGVGRGIGSALTVLGYLVLTPVLSFFVLRDWDGLRRRATELVPDRHRPLVVSFASDYDDLLARYLRGQLALATVVGLIIGVGLWIAGFPYALLIGLLAGVLNLVPYLGLIVSLLVALVIALFSGAVVASLVKLAIVFGVEQVLETVLQPLIVGKSVDLHPVWLILALALCGFFLGFVGLLLAAPLAVLVKLAAARAMARYGSGDDGEATTAPAPAETG